MIHINKVLYIRLGICLLAVCCSYSVLSQNNPEKALIKGKQAQELEDAGKTDQAIALFKEARQLDSLSLDYPYELGYIYSSLKDYQTALTYLEKLPSKPGASDLVFQLLGNCYEGLSENDKALEIYTEGLQRFPESGRLYQETGTFYMGKKEYNKALVYFEKGIKAEPSFVSNYFWAAKLYCHSTESVWGLMYGELFMNLEHESPRTAEMSKLLFDTYKTGILFTSDTSLKVNFSKNVYSEKDGSDSLKSKKLPFGVGLFEPLMLLSAMKEKVVDLNSLDRIRQKFLVRYYAENMDKEYPNILFDYQQQVQKAGFLEVYNHWLLMRGDEKSFVVWKGKNKTQWEAFSKWFAKNPLALDKKHCLYRGQY